jgi:hypothetical protein
MSRKKKEIQIIELRSTRDGSEKRVAKSFSMTETRYRGYELYFGNMNLTVSSGFDMVGKEFLIKAIKNKKIINPSKDLLIDLGLEKRRDKYE